MEPFILPNAGGDDDFTVAASGRQEGEWVEDLQGITGLSIFARFSFGATALTGASAIVYIQTSFSGEAAFDIAAFEFNEAPETVALNIDGEAQLAPTNVTDGAMTPGTVLHGAIGDRVRAVVVTNGPYSGSTLLALRGAPRP